MHSHDFSAICIQFLANRFEARFMSRGLLFSPNAGIRRTLKEPDHLVHVPVQEIEFLTQIGFHRRHSSFNFRRHPQLFGDFAGFGVRAHP
jgi:hypothetical protein